MVVPRNVFLLPKPSYSLLSESKSSEAEENEQEEESMLMKCYSMTFL